MKESLIFTLENTCQDVALLFSEIASVLVHLLPGRSVRSSCPITKEHEDNRFVRRVSSVWPCPGALRVARHGLKVLGRVKLFPSERRLRMGHSGWIPRYLEHFAYDKSDLLLA
jgi:hypothetical protein